MSGVRGIKRGRVPEEELDWLRDNIECDSLNQLFDDYCEEFGSPYSTIDSFRAILSRYNIFPVPQTLWEEQPNLCRFLLIVQQEASYHWTITPRPSDKIKGQEPHWLWKWHHYSRKTATGTVLLPYPIRTEEKQFGEE